MPNYHILAFALSVHVICGIWPTSARNTWPQQAYRHFGASPFHAPPLSSSPPPLAVSPFYPTTSPPLSRSPPPHAVSPSRPSLSHSSPPHAVFPSRLFPAHLHHTRSSPVSPPSDCLQLAWRFSHATLDFTGEPDQSFTAIVWARQGS
jgi:hypothetical protein